MLRGKYASWMMNKWISSINAMGSPQLMVSRVCINTGLVSYGIGDWHITRPINHTGWWWWIIITRWGFAYLFRFCWLLDSILRARVRTGFGASDIILIWTSLWSPSPACYVQINPQDPDVLLLQFIKTSVIRPGETTLCMDYKVGTGDLLNKDWPHRIPKLRRLLLTIFIDSICACGEAGITNWWCDDTLLAAPRRPIVGGGTPIPCIQAFLTLCTLCTRRQGGLHSSWWTWVDV